MEPFKFRRSNSVNMSAAVITLRSALSLHPLCHSMLLLLPWHLHGEKTQASQYASQFCCNGNLEAYQLEGSCQMCSHTAHSSVCSRPVAAATKGPVFWALLRSPNYIYYLEGHQRWQPYSDARQGLGQSTKNDYLLLSLSLEVNLHAKGLEV